MQRSYITDLYNIMEEDRKVASFRKTQYDDSAIPILRAVSRRTDVWLRGSYLAVKAHRYTIFHIHPQPFVAAETPSLVQACSASPVPTHR